MEMKEFVFGIGRTNIDIIYSGLKRLPSLGEELYSQNFEIHLGGGVPGEAVILSRLGVPTKAVTWLGKSVFSGIAEKEFRIGNPQIINLYHGTEEPCALSTAMLCNGDRTFVSYQANIGFTDEDIKQIRKEVQGAKIVLLNSHYPELYKSLDLSPSVRIFDTGWDDGLSLEDPKYRFLVETADYYLPNRKEALKITGTGSIDEAADILSLYLKKVVIKLDGDGCMIRDENGTRIIPPLSGITAVDSTGAGDAFLCGFTYGLFRGYGIDDCVRLGNITGGTCVQSVGCVTKTLTETELLTLAETNYPMQR